MKKFRNFQNIRKEEKKSKAGLYFTIFIAVIMIASVGSVFFYGDQGSAEYTYGKYDFKSSGSMWISKVNGKEIRFYMLPDQVKTMNVSDEVGQVLKNAQGLIVTFNPEQNLTTRLQAIDVLRLEIADALTNVNKQTFFAVTKESDIYKFPIATCDNSSSVLPVLTVDYGEYSKINLINSCISLSARDEFELIALLDNLRYRIYGVFDGKEE